MILRSIKVLIALLIATGSAYGTEPAKSSRPMLLKQTVQLKQFKPVTPVIIRQPLKTKLNLRPLVPAKPVKPTGPDPKASVDLADMIDDPDLLQDLALTCGWDPHLIFQDKTAGNVFYYMPREFLLVHDPATGYQLNVQYNNMTDPESPSVMLTAELSAPHRTGDIVLLKQILKQAFNLKPNDTLTLKSISGIGATPDMHSITAGLALSEDRISVALPAHFKKSFRLTLLLKQDETEEVLAQITREGLMGSLNVKIGDDTVPVPINIRYSSFTGNNIDGFDQWVNNRPKGTLRNVTSFPLQIDSINCYRMKNNKLERISKNLKPSTLAPEKEKPFKIPAASKLLGNGILLAWMGTNLDLSCEECFKAIDKQVRKGVAAAPSTPVKFEIIPGVFEDFEIYKIIIQVQSPYFSPDAGQVESREVELTEDENISQDLLIYAPQDKGPEPLLYKYRLTLITVDGESFVEPEWNKSRSATRFFGAKQIEPLLGDSSASENSDDLEGPEG